MATKTIQVPDKKFEHEEKPKEMHFYREQHPVDPRTHDQTGFMLCKDGDYNIGDRQFDTDNFGGWGEVKKQIKEENNVKAIKPLYLLDHSGLRIQTTPFKGQIGRWDSWQVGFIYITEEQLDKLGVKEENRTEENFNKWLEQEVTTYDQYLRGDTWRFQLTEDGEVVDSCGGFYGFDKENMFEHAGENPENYTEQD